MLLTLTTTHKPATDLGYLLQKNPGAASLCGHVVRYTHGASTDDLSYGYDPAGRRTGMWGSYGRVSLPTATTSNAVYDLANRLTSWNGATVANDNNGNLTSDGTFTYTYSPRNQLTLVKQGNQTRGSYTYDGLGRRVVRTVGGTTTKPAYDGWNLVQERASNGNSVVANYLTGLGLDQPFKRTAGTSTSYYLSDALGSIVGLADQTGAVPTSYTYEPYGKTTVSGTSSGSFLGFTGRENDSTGTLSLYNYRARAYSPTLHRFLTEDPIGYAGGEINVYAYVGDRPTYTIDPSGQFVLNLISGAIGFVSGFTGSALNGGGFVDSLKAGMAGGTAGLLIPGGGLLGTVLSGAASGALGDVFGQLIAWDGRKDFQLNLGEVAFAGVSGAVAAPLTASLGAGAVSATAALGPWASRASEVVVQGVGSGALDAFAQRTRALAGVNPTVRIPRCWLQVDLQRTLAC